MILDQIPRRDTIFIQSSIIVKTIHVKSLSGTTITHLYQKRVSQEIDKRAISPKDYIET